MNERDETVVRTEEGPDRSAGVVVVWDLEGWPCAVLPCCRDHVVGLSQLGLRRGHDVRLCTPRTWVPCVVCSLTEVSHVVS